MTDSISVAIILGTAREGRHSEKVLPGVIAAAKERGWDITEIDVRDHPQQLTDREAGDDVFRSQLASADAFVIVTPEYNSSYPGELKLLIDRQHGEFAHKPVGLVTVSAGATGGARVSLSLLPVLTSIRAVVVQPPVQIRDVRGSEDPFTDSRHDRLLRAMLGELEFYARPLRDARDRRRVGSD